MHFLLAAEEKSAGGLAALGLNVPSLLFQLINFVIVYWVLSKWVFPVIVRLLENRRKRIEQGLHDAEAARTARMKAEDQRKQVLKDAREEAAALVAAARSEAQSEAARIVAEAQESANASVEQARARITNEQQKARRELTAELGQVVAAATAAVTAQAVTPEADSQVVARALEEAGAWQR